MECAGTNGVKRGRGGTKGGRDRMKDVRSWDVRNVWKPFLISLSVYSHICLVAKLNCRLTGYYSSYT
jgi:hypothetical protein